jgi:hypothetical protein
MFPAADLRVLLEIIHIAQVRAVENRDLFSVDPVQVRVESIVVNVRQLDHTAGGLFPLISTGCFEEVGLLGKKTLGYGESGRVLSALVDDDSELLSEVRCPVEVSTQSLACGV